jgi:hypothetical protein
MSARKRKRKRKKVTIEDLAGPCDLNYDTALAEYEVAKRHSLAGDSALPAISALALDQLAKDFLKRKLAKIR